MRNFVRYERESERPATGVVAGTKARGSATPSDPREGPLRDVASVGAGPPWAHFVRLVHRGPCPRSPLAIACPVR